MDRFLQQLQLKARETQKESSAEEGYSTNEESDLVHIMLCYLFCCLVLTVLLDLFRTSDANIVPKCYILEYWICWRKQWCNYISAKLQEMSSVLHHYMPFMTVKFSSSYSFSASDLKMQHFPQNSASTGNDAFRVHVLQQMIANWVTATPSFQMQSHTLKSA